MNLQRLLEFFEVLPVQFCGEYYNYLFHISLRLPIQATLYRGNLIDPRSYYFARRSRGRKTEKRFNKYIKMSGILDNVRCDCLEGDKRNSVAAAVAGALFFTGWWIIIDVAAHGPSSEQFEGAYYVCGVFGTISLFMINSVSNGQLRGDTFTDGCAGPRTARLWLFTGLVLGFASLIASGWILFAGYVLSNSNAEDWYGVAVFLQNLFIFGSSLVYKFGRSEDLWG